MITPGKYVPCSKSVYWFKSYLENRILNTYILGDFAIAFWAGTVSIHFISEYSIRTIFSPILHGGGCD